MGVNSLSGARARFRLGYRRERVPCRKVANSNLISRRFRVPNRQKIRQCFCGKRTYVSTVSCLSRLKLTTTTRATPRYPALWPYSKPNTFQTCAVSLTKFLSWSAKRKKTKPGIRIKVLRTQSSPSAAKFPDHSLRRWKHWSNFTILGMVLFG